MDELLAAVADCDTETIAECLDAGADLHHVGLIHEAVSTDDMQVVTLLLGRGAQVNQRDANGRTPLHCAQSRGVADVLLRSGADVTARDASGLTPVEERRAFGVRGLSEVADFIHSWRGKTDLKPRNVDEILKEETAIRDEISRLQSAVSQMSGQAAPGSGRRWSVGFRLSNAEAGKLLAELASAGEEDAAALAAAVPAGSGAPPAVELTSA